MRIRKMICILLFTVLLFCTACAAFGEAAEPDYYRVGLKVAGLLSEITDSEAYLSLLTRPEMFREVREQINTHDYDRPVAVYSIRLSDPEAIMKEMLRDNPESLEAFESLSPALQEQFLGYMSIQSLCAAVNGRMGTEYLAFLSVATSRIRDDTLTGEASGCYLYLFEKGTPIMVSFGYRGASGQFLLIPEESRGNPEDIAAYLALPGLELTPVTAETSAPDPEAP